MAYEEKPGSTTTPSVGGEYNDDGSSGTSSYPIEYTGTNGEGGYQVNPGATGNLSAGGEYDNLETADSLSYTNLAAQSAGEAATSAAEAAESLAEIGTSVAQAAASATFAAGSATSAANSATSASTSAATATTKASEASTSATNAATSATSASTSATTATTQATAASASATSAAASATTATAKASEASTSASNAATSATTATTKASEASSSASSAAASATTATTQATSATTSASNAASSATAASNSATSAATSATTATTQATNAASSATTATTQATNAASSASAALTSANNASTSATSASGSASSASTSATTATTKAGEATASATNAASSASNAATSATAANTSATAANSSATSASNSATSASTSAATATVKASEASTSATSAASSASAASTSANNASTAASAAGTSASNAANSATAAGTSATNAASSATAASGSASTASTQASNAATSATNAANSATSASTSASTATTKASEAATSATNAATSATSAGTSATNATTSATSALSAQAAAEAARDQALAAFDNFDDKYLGEKASDPTVDNDGNPLVTGALYFNTTLNIMKVYSGSAWLAAYASLSGALIAANNLSDLTNVVTARTNLGLGTAATTSSTAYATAAQGNKADTALQPSTIGVSVQGYNANTVFDASYVHTDNNYTTTEKNKLAGIQAGAEVNVNANWTSISGDSQILNKPTLGTAAAQDVGYFATAAQGTLADNALSALTSADGSVAITTTGTTRDLSVLSSASTTTLISQVRNETGGILSKGTVVYISGAAGNKALVSKALANADSTSAQTYGMVQADIANNNNGYVVIIGTVSGLNTAAFANGTQLYLSGTVAGSYTSTKPYAPTHMVYVGVVTYSHANQGTIEVKIQNGYEMDELHNVSAQTPSNGNTLVYNTSNSLWESTSTLSGSYTLSGGTANGVTYLNNSKVLTSGSGLTFDGTNLGVGTASPAQKLVVSGAGAQRFDIIDTGGATSRVSTSGGVGYFGLTTNHPMVLFTNDAERVRINASGNVGIGTSSPIEKLDVNGVINSNSSMVVTKAGSDSIGSGPYFYLRNSALTTSAWVTQLGASNSYDFWGYSDGSGWFKRATIDSSGNLGLGVTPSAWETVSAIQVKARSSLFGFSNDTHVGYNLYYTSAGYRYVATDNASDYQQTGGQHRWFNAPSGTAGNVISFTQAMTLDASGNLQLGGTAIGDGRLNIAGITGASAGFHIGYGGNGDNYYTSGASGIQVFRTNTTERMRLDADGNLDIGLTAGRSVGGYRFLSAAGSSGAYVDLYAGATRIGSMGAESGSLNLFADANVPLVFGTNSAERMRITAGGNVSIGSTNETGKLTVTTTEAKAVNATPLALSTSDASNQFQLIFARSTNSYYSIQSVEQNVAFRNLVMQTSGGNLGVGTTSPAYKLDVTGVVRSSGSFNPSTSGWTNAAFRAEGSYGGALAFVDGSAGYGVWTQDLGGSLIFGQGNTSGGLTERMRLTNTGLGIGTSSPVGRLTLRGAAGTSGKNQGILLEYSNGTEYGALGLNNSSGWLQLMGRAGAGLTFHVNSDLVTTGEAMRLDASGNLGIGTASPATRLHVSTSAFNVATFDSTYGQMAISFSNSGTTFAQIGSGISVTSTAAIDDLGFGTAGLNKNIVFANGTSYTERMRIDSSGNVGIGTTSPAVRLHVVGSTAAFFDKSSDVAQPSTRFRTVRDSYATQWAISQPPSSLDFAFNYFNGTAWGEAARISTSGNLGIGTSAPAVRLDVDSGTSPTARFRNTYTFAGGNYAIAIVGDTSTAGYISQNPAAGGIVVASGMRYYGAGPWTPDSTSASSLQQTGGNFIFTSNTGLTAGTNFTPSERMRLDSSGNLGLGVNPNAWNGGLIKAIQIGDNNGSISSFTTGNTVSDWLFLNNNAYYDGSWKYIASSTAAQYALTSNEHRWYNTASGTAGNAITFTQAMTLDADGDLGIGTTSPSNKLHVKQTSDASGIRLESNANDSQFLMYNNNSQPEWRVVATYGSTGSFQPITFWTSDNKRMTLDTAGNLGLGVTPSAWSSIKAIQTGTAASFSGGSGFNDAFIASNAFYDGTNWKYLNSNPAYYSSVGGSAAARWYTAASGTAGNNVSFTQVMTLNASGSLGVGATSVQGALNIERSSSAGTVAATASVVLSNPNSTAGTFVAGGIFSNTWRDITTSQYTAGVWFEKQNSAVAGTAASQGAVIFGANDYTNAGDLPVERMRLSSIGVLGIGVTPSNWTASIGLIDFRYNGALSSDASYAYFSNNIYYDGANKRKAAGHVSLFQVGNTGTPFVWQYAGTGAADSTISLSEAMRINGSGNLGIGTTTPAGKLTVSSAGASGIDFVPAFSGTSNLIQSYHQSGGYYVNLVYDSSSHVFNINAVERIRINGSGNLGIATSSPATRLHVNGGSTAPTTNSVARFDTTATTAYSGGSYVGGQLRLNYGSATDSYGGINFSNFGATSQEFFGVVQNSSGYGSFVWQGYNGSAYAERMRLDSSGNLGLGVTPSALATTAKVIQFAYGSTVGVATGGDFNVTSNAYNSGSNAWTYHTSSLGASRYQSDFGIHKWYTAPTGTAGNAITFTQAMTLTAEGNLGIGSTSPTNLSNYKTITMNATTGSIIDLQSAGTTLGRIQTDTTYSLALWTATATPMVFGTNYTERARIDSSGNLLVGLTATAAYQDGRINAVGAGSQPAITGTISSSAGTQFVYSAWSQPTTGNNNFVSFETETTATVRGTISYNRGAGLVAYNITSDYRAKDIIGPVTGSGELIDSTPVYMGKMKGATQERPMFIAHETPEYAHTGVKDAVDVDGNPVYQQMDASALIPVMWAEIQSLRKRLADAGI